ncbi:MAG: bifunctional riboflavin kinase/FAD synthetase [Chitinophagales bacterium]
MLVHRNFDSLPVFQNAVITIGTFDGVHRGHQKLIEKTREKALQIRGENVLITFDPHPRTIVFQNEDTLRLLSTMDEKIKLLEQYGADHLVIVPFTREFSLLSAKDYVEKFLVSHFHPAVIVIGYNHQFGHHRDGNIELLRKLSAQYHFQVEEIPKQMVDEIEVSSTRIRIALQEGDVKTTSHLLGHYYSLSGRVIRGEQLGRKLGFPTANLSVPEMFKLIPADGVYAVTINIDQETRNGVMSIGMRPTVNGSHRTIETYIFDFAADLYEKVITVNFIGWIREEIKFESLDLMAEEIGRDVIRAKKILTEI